MITDVCVAERLSLRENRPATDAKKKLKGVRCHESKNRLQQVQNRSLQRS